MEVVGLPSPAELLKRKARQSRQRISATGEGSDVLFLLSSCGILQKYKQANKGKKVFSLIVIDSALYKSVETFPDYNMYMYLS